jgi:hypothetical protein
MIFFYDKKYPLNKMNILRFLSIVVACLLLIYLLYKITQEIRDNYEDKNEDPYVLSLIAEIRKIDPAVDKIVDHLKFYEGKKSYTINKTYVHLCKFDENGELYNKNQLVLVLIHELAHSLCNEVGHTAKFYAIMDDLLEKAEKTLDKNNVPLYNSKIPHVERYCEY